jgi:hypothetical protein
MEAVLTSIFARVETNKKALQANVRKAEITLLKGVTSGEVTPEQAKAWLTRINVAKDFSK